MSRHRHQSRPLPVRACPTPEKRGYVDRKTAKRVMRRWSSGRERGLNAYLCECGLFHLGHVPPPVVRGELGRPDVRRSVA